MNFLAECALEGVTLGTCRDREFGGRILSDQPKVYAYIRISVLPCVLVFERPSDCRIDHDCLNTKSTPALEDVARSYYALIETILTPDWNPTGAPIGSKNGSFP